MLLTHNDHRTDLEAIGNKLRKNIITKWRAK